MNLHLKIVGWLHIAAGLFALSLIVLFWWAVAGLQPLFSGSFIPELVAFFGKPIAITVIALTSLELAAAVALLCGKAAARHVLALMGVLHLWAFPIGTALALYTAWAAWGQAAPLPATARA